LKKQAESMGYSAAVSEEMEKPLEFHIEDGGKRLVSVDQKDGKMVFTRD
jgi:hypothetical protein